VLAVAGMALTLLIKGDVELLLKGHHDFDLYAKCMQK
jgi:hypothetical protein